MRALLLLPLALACSQTRVSPPEEQAWISPFPGSEIIDVKHPPASKSGKADASILATFWRLPAGSEPDRALDHYAAQARTAQYRIKTRFVTDSKQAILQATQGDARLSVSIDVDPSDDTRLFAVVTTRGSK